MSNTPHLRARMDKEYRSDIATFVATLRKQWIWASAAAFSGLLVALTEPFGIALVVPLLSAENSNPMQSVPILGPVVESLLLQPKSSLISIVAIFLIATAVARGILSVLNRIFLEIQRRRLETDLRRRVIDQIFNLQPHFIEQQKIGSLGTMLVSHVSITAALADRLSNTASSVLQMTFMVSLMLLIDWQLTIAAVVLLGSISLLIKFQLGSRLKVLAQKANTELIESAQSLIELASNIRSIQFLGIARPMRGKALGHVEEYGRLQQLRMTFLGTISPLFAGALGIALGLLLLIAGFAPNNPEGTIAKVLVLLIIMSRLMTPVTIVTELLAYASDNWHQVSQVMKFLSRDGKPYLIDGSKTLSGAVDSIHFDDVSFNYPASGSGIKNVSLMIEKGSCIAFVGPSGSGKTTLISLLARLMDPDSGRILAGGQNIRDLRLESWRAQLAVVAQDSFTLNATIAENLRLASPEASDAELWGALDKANAKAFVEALPHGLQTRLGDRAMNLSGGQRQRLSIARAILSDRRILVLDEAFNQLDADTEKSVNDAIARLRGEFTIIIIAHGLSAIRNADTIHVLHEGRLVASGAHAELIANNAIYRRFVDLQAKPSIEPLSVV